MAATGLCTHVCASDTAAIDDLRGRLLVSAATSGALEPGLAEYGAARDEMGRSEQRCRCCVMLHTWMCHSHTARQILFSVTCGHEIKL